MPKGPRGQIGSHCIKMNGSYLMDQAQTIRVDIEEQEGWHVATSRDLPGLVLAHESRERVLDALPGAIRLLYSHRHKCDCIVFFSPFAGESDATNAPWVVIPPEVARAQLAAA